MRPFASDGVAGKMTFRPGMWAQSAVQSCECCAPYLEPTETRRTMGILRMPADIACHFAIWLNISSPAHPMKSAYMSSTMARPPHMAYPTAEPTIADSDIGALKNLWYGTASVIFL